MKSIEFRTNPMFLRNQFKGDGIFDIPLLQTDEIDLEEIELIGYDKLRFREQTINEGGLNQYPRPWDPESGLNKNPFK